MGLNFYYYDGLQPEMGAGIINEHECTLSNFWVEDVNNTWFLWADKIIVVCYNSI